MMHRLLCLCTSMALAACATTPGAMPPQIIRVPVNHFIAIPAALLLGCPIAEPSDRTVGTLLGIAYARKQALVRCNAQIDAIRHLQPSTTP